MRQRSIIHVLAATALAAAAVGASAPAAHAYASGCDSWTLGKIWFPIDIPRGYLCQDIQSNGRYIEWQKVSWRAPNLCNTRMDLVYRDLNGNVYRRDNADTSNNCGVTSSVVVARNFEAQLGTACVELFSNGEHKSTQCHAITD